MNRLNRRDWMELGAAGWAASVFPCMNLAAEALNEDGLLQPVPSSPYEFPYKALGEIKPVASKDIEASPLSVGFETLDRKMFDPERAYEHVGRLGVKWARCQTGWARTELCALFDARTKCHSSDPPNVLDTTLAEHRIQYLSGGRFVRDGKAVHVYWFAGELPEPFEPQTARIEFPLSDQATIEQPVLIDPLSRQVYQLNGLTRRDDRLIVENLPLLDHPLLIADRRVALT